MYWLVNVQKHPILYKEAGSSATWSRPPIPMSASPRLLYRYRSLAPNSIDYVQRTITDGEVYFAKPSSFNDPFDCQPAYKFDATDPEILNYFVRVGSKPQHGLKPNAAVANAITKLHNRVSGPRSTAAGATAQQLHTETIAEKIGVLCLSEIRDDLLMWGHYADNHKGLCLGFDRSHPFFSAAHPVTYSEARPTVNPIRDTTDQMLQAAIFTKAAHWSYEREWRQVRYQDGAGTANIPTEALAVVILGCKASRESEELLKSWLHKRTTRPRILRAQPATTKFALQFRTT